MNAVVSSSRTRNRDGQPWLQLQSTGIWRICHSPGDGSTIRLSTKTRDEDEAKAQLEAYRLSLLGGVRQLVTVSEVLDYYIEWHVREHANDVERRLLALEWLRASLGSRTLASLTSEDITRYIRDRRKGTAPVHAGRTTRNPVEGAADSTLYYDTGALMTAFTFCEDRGKIAPNLLPRFTRPQNGRKESAIWFNEKERDWLLNFLHLETDESGRMSRIWRFVALALGTAARKASIVRLRWDAVHFDTRMIHYEDGVIQRPGMQASSKKSVSVPIAKWLLPLLERAYRERTGDYVLDEPIFPSGSLEGLQRRAFKASGNDKYAQMTPHTFRHTRATLMARAGVPIGEIAEILGNTHAVCSKHYLHHCPDHLRRAIDA